MAHTMKRREKNFVSLRPMRKKKVKVKKKKLFQVEACQQSAVEAKTIHILCNFQFCLLLVFISSLSVPASLILGPVLPLKREQ